MSGEGEVPDETVFVADSVDEFVERERHRQLLGAKEDAAASFRRAAELRIDTSVGQDDIRDLVRQAVENYVLEAESLFDRTEAGRALWDEAEIDVFPARRAVGLLAHAQPSDATVADIRSVTGLPVYRQDGRPVFALQGVGQFLELAETTVEVDFEVSVNTHNPAATRTQTQRLPVTVPVRVSREVFRATNALLEELGMGVRMEAEQTDVQSDYTTFLDDILKR